MHILWGRTFEKSNSQMHTRISPFFPPSLYILPPPINNNPNGKFLEASLLSHKPKMLHRWKFSRTQRHRDRNTHAHAHMRARTHPPTHVHGQYTCAHTSAHTSITTSRRGRWTSSKSVSALDIQYTTPKHGVQSDAEAGAQLRALLNRGSSKTDAGGRAWRTAKMSW